MWLAYAARQLLGMVLTVLRMVPLALLNRFSHAEIPAHGEVVISLTTHGRRVKSVHFAIESLARGRVSLPIVLWLDADDFDAPWPPALRRLVARGLRIACSDGDFGPHTKYWSQFREVEGTHRKVITADDDMIYPSWFAERLIFVGGLRLGTVIAYRAHRIELRDGRIVPYMKWTPVDTSEASFLHFATGVSGVLYPPDFISYVVAQGDAFMEASPRADDVWLHACAVRSNHRVRQVHSHPQHFSVVPTTQLGSLAISNMMGGGNDAQIRRVYTAEDLQRLHEETEVLD